MRPNYNRRYAATTTKKKRRTSKAKKKPVKARKTTKPTLWDGNVRAGWTIDEYREAHKQIPGEVYNTDDVGPTKTVKKKNYAPLGRPPDAVKRSQDRMKYNRAKARLTPHGERVLDHQKRHQRVYRPSMQEEMKYLRYMDNWEDERAAARYGMNVLDNEIEAELEDRGYQDERRYWKRMSKKNKARAYMDKAREDWLTYGRYE